MIAAVGSVLLLAAAAGMVARSLAVRWQPWILTATFAPYLMLLAVPAAILYALALSPAAAIGPVAIGAFLTIQSLPRRATRYGTGPRLQVLTANLLFGRADPAALIEVIRQHRVDVLMAQELTPEAHELLLEHGIEAELPHRFVQPAPSGSGTGLYTRYPLSDAVSHDGFAFATLSARLLVPDDVAPGSRPVVVAAHLQPPYPFPCGQWTDELVLLRTLLEDHPHGADGVIMGGDLNATCDHAEFRALLAGSLVDAGEQTGRKRLRSYPAHRLIPLLGLDHIVLLRANARRVELIDLPGSDHLGVLAEVQLRSISDGN